MNGQDTKIVQLIADMTVDNGDFTTTEIDRLGYDAATIVVSFGNVPANVAALQVTQSDTAGSGHTAISGTVVGTDADSTGSTSSLPAASGGDGTSVVFELNLLGKKRYLDLNVTAGNGSGTATECSAVCILSRAKDVPVSATERGVAAILRA